MKRVVGLCVGIVAGFVLYHHLVQLKVPIITTVDIALVSMRKPPILLFEMLLPSFVAALGYGLITRFYDPRRNPWTWNRIVLYLVVFLFVGSLQLLHYCYNHAGRFTLLSDWNDLEHQETVSSLQDLFLLLLRRAIVVLMLTLIGSGMGLGLSEYINVKCRRVSVSGLPSNGAA